MSTEALPQSMRAPLVRFGHASQMPLLVALAYLLGAKAAFLIGTLSDNIFAPFWPPNTILLCALLFTPMRRWWVFILATFPAHVIAEVGVGMPPSQWLVAFITNCLFAVGSAAALLWLVEGPPWFNSLRKASLYIVITAVVVPAVVALGGAFVPILGGGSLQNFGQFWAQWYLSNALGSLTLGPVALMVLSEWRWRPFRAPVLTVVEVILLTVALVAICAFVFEVHVDKVASGFLPTLFYAPLPVILWAAVRFGVKGASGAILIVTVVLIWRALSGPTVFLAHDAEMSVLAIQAFLMGLALPILLLGSSIDETRHAERATRESEERIAFAAASANICMWQLEYQSNRFWLTKHGRDMFGFKADERITRQSVIDAIHPDDRNAALQSMRSAMASGTLADPEFRVVRSNAEIRWLRARARAHVDEEGKPTHVSGTFTDVTDRKAAELEAAQQRLELAHLMRVSMLGELSGGLAHELTQPLTAILSNAQAARLLMDNEEPDMTEVSAVLDDIILEDNRAGEVIHRLRGLLKKGETKFEPLDVNELIHSTLRLMHSELISRRVRIENDLSENLPLVMGDPVQLQQVILNLVMNAVDAMNDMTPARRIMTITSVPTNKSEIIVRIADRGVGLMPSYQDRLFQPFFTTKARGLGLGLSISTSIIKAHGGALKLESNPDGGAIATFVLPSPSASGGSAM